MRNVADILDVLPSGQRWIAPLRLLPAAGSACCCPSDPTVQVLMPPTAERRATELLLCAHHYRASLECLARFDAWVYGVSGDLLGAIPTPAGFVERRRAAVRS